MLTNRWYILALLIAVRAAMGFQFQSVSAVAPMLSESMNVDYAGIGVLIGLYMLPGLFIALPGGFLGSRFQDLTVAGFGTLMMSIGAAISAMDAGFQVFAAGRLLSGAGAVLQGIFVIKMIVVIVIS